ncbi:CAP domain-containing protein [Thermus caldilimi]|uniref:CAP domain-containing protein n=1 Tax=Thermus caldilimi TaxID=2483360 RepID=UPI001F10F776|nr:CAP domain-containing protein [Thermus caldilimi]
MRRKSLLPLPRLTLAALSALALLLSACQNLVQTPRPPVEALAGTGELLEARPGETRQVKVRLAQGAESAEVYLRLADPCAKGTSYCPGWDATRYPGVEHTRERFTLTATNLEATFTLSVAQDALPQGPFKWELVAVDEKGREWTFPVYLRIPSEGQGAVAALREWRARAGLPGVEEDPEWAWRGWLHSRYSVMNGASRLPHDEDLSQPFSSGEGRSAGRVGNEWGSLGLQNGRASWSPDQSPVNWWIAAPFHRFGLIYPWSLQVGSGIYRDVLPWNGVIFGHTRATLPYFSSSSTPNPGVQEVPFPVPGMRVPVASFDGYENPNPAYPCLHPEVPRQRPFFSQPGIDWNASGLRPFGFPVTLMTFARADTEVLEARLVRVSDGAVNPVCAYGSLQYWDDRDFWRNAALSILNDLGAVIVLPREPLTPGAEYEVYLKARIGSQVWEKTWRFQVETQENLWPTN